MDTVNDIARAFSMLGLGRGASLADARRRYRFFARRWHPDRFARDPRNQAEAGVEMRRINGAYRLLIEHFSNLRTDNRPATPPRERLSPEEVDHIAREIGSEGPIDALLSALGWVGSILEGVVLVFAALWLVGRAVSGLWSGDYTVFREHPDVLLFALLASVLGLREFLVRRRVLRDAKAHGGT